MSDLDTIACLKSLEAKVDELSNDHKDTKTMTLKNRQDLNDMHRQKEEERVGAVWHQSLRGLNPLRTRRYTGNILKERSVMVLMVLMIATLTLMLPQLLSRFKCQNPTVLHSLRMLVVMLFLQARLCCGHKLFQESHA